MSVPSRSGFLELPFELRRKVYEYLAARSIESPTFDNSSIKKKPHPDHQILRVCRQCHEEAAAVLYSMPIFRASAPVYLPRFLKRVGRRNAAAIRHVAFTLISAKLNVQMGDLRVVLARLPGLARLEVTVDLVCRGDDGSWDAAIRERQIGECVAALTTLVDEGARLSMLVQRMPRALNAVHLLLTSSSYKVSVWDRLIIPRPNKEEESLATENTAAISDAPTTATTCSHSSNQGPQVS